MREKDYTSTSICHENCHEYGIKSCIIGSPFLQLPLLQYGYIIMIFINRFTFQLTSFLFWLPLFLYLQKLKCYAIFLYTCLKSSDQKYVYTENLWYTIHIVFSWCFTKSFFWNESPFAFISIPSHHFSTNYNNWSFCFISMLEH